MSTIKDQKQTEVVINGQPPMSFALLTERDIGEILKTAERMKSELLQSLTEATPAAAASESAAAAAVAPRQLLATSMARKTAPGTIDSTSRLWTNTPENQPLTRSIGRLNDNHTKSDLADKYINWLTAEGRELYKTTANWRCATCADVTRHRCNPCAAKWYEWNSSAALQSRYPATPVGATFTLDYGDFKITPGQQVVAFRIDPVPVPAAAAAAAASAPVEKKRDKRKSEPEPEWSADEDEWLILLVCQDTIVPRKALHLRWNTISSRMKMHAKSSHDADACKDRWAILYHYVITGPSHRWTVMDDVYLITAVYETGERQIEDIKWERILGFADFTPARLKTRFTHLRSFYPRKSFDADIEQMHKDMASRLKLAHIPHEDWCMSESEFAATTAGSAAAAASRPTKKVKA